MNQMKPMNGMSVRQAIDLRALREQDEIRKTYQQVRDEIRLGDILLFQGQVWLSRVIRCLSQGPYSHSALVAPAWGDRVLVMQAEPVGVEIVPASHAVTPYDGLVDWWALKEEPRSHFNKSSFLNAMLEAIGKPYGYLRLIGLGFRLWLHRTQLVADRRAASYFCSQYVAYVLREAGLDVSKLGDAETTPTDIAKSNLFEYRATLHKAAD
jgi:hypothetical protein